MTGLRRSLWIAADLIKDAGASGAFVGLGLFLGLWLPTQAGLIDGLHARAGLAGWMRRSLVMNASWPALAVLGIHAQVFYPRRLRRELEPLLAAPVTDLEIVIGLSLPVILVMVFSPPITFGLNLLGLWITSGGFPVDPVSDLGHLWIATQTACVWLTAFSVDASFKARSQGGYVLRVMVGYLVLAGFDAILLVLRLTGSVRLAAPAMILALVSGAGASWVVSRRIDREDLLQRI